MPGHIVVIFKENLKFLSLISFNSELKIRVITALRVVPENELLNFKGPQKKWDVLGISYGNLYIFCRAELKSDVHSATSTSFRKS